MDLIFKKVSELGNNNCIEFDVSIIANASNEHNRRR